VLTSHRKRIYYNTLQMLLSFGTRRSVGTLRKREILELIEAMEAFAEPVEVVMKTRPMSPDPSLDMVLDVAINGGQRR
jgi:hypothetical protein